MYVLIVILILKLNTNYPMGEKKVYRVSLVDINPKTLWYKQLPDFMLKDYFSAYNILKLICNRDEIAERVGNVDESPETQDCIESIELMKIIKHSSQLYVCF